MLKNEGVDLGDEFKQTIHPSVTVFFLFVFLIPLWGHMVFCWSQSQLSLGEGRVLPGQVASSLQGLRWWQRLWCKLHIRSNFGFSILYLAQVHFNMQLSSAWNWDLNRNLLITSRPALPTELQPPFKTNNDGIFSWNPFLSWQWIKKTFNERNCKKYYYISMSLSLRVAHCFSDFHSEIS